MNDTLSKHALGDIVYKPVDKIADHEYLLPLDGQTLDSTKYKRLTDYLGTATLPNLNGRYLRADTNSNQMVDAGLPNIQGRSWTKCWGDFVSLIDGAFYSTIEANVSDAGTGTDKYHNIWVNFDAKRCSSIYGNSDTVTPLTYTVRAYICYA